MNEAPSLFNPIKEGTVKNCSSYIDNDRLQKQLDDNCQ
jgi:hypothetical protein